MQINPAHNLTGFRRSPNQMHLTRTVRLGWPYPVPTYRPAGAPIPGNQLTMMLNNAVGVPVLPEQLCYVLNYVAPMRGWGFNANLPFWPWQFRPRPVNSAVFNWGLNFMQFLPVEFPWFSGIQFPTLLVRRGDG